MKRLLIVSFSPIYRDPRILRQITALTEEFEVTTMGWGQTPPGVKRHIELPSAEKLPLWKKAISGVRLALSSAKGKYRAWPDSKAALKWVREHRDEFDVVFVNDVLTIPIGLETGKPVHADIHEYALDQGKSWRWRTFVRPMLRWTASLLPQVDSVSMSSPGHSARYHDLFDFEDIIVTSSPRERPILRPTTERNDGPIRLVHLGVGVEHRSLDMPLMSVQRANEAKPGSVELDFYLVPGDRSYIERLKDKAGDSKITGVRFCKPVEFDEIVETLHEYDAAVVYFPPKTLSLKHTLPNKFFEAVQARIGVIIGPSDEMRPYLSEYGFGVATPDWTQQSLDEVIQSLNWEDINKWKIAADKAASELGASKQNAKWVNAVKNLVSEAQ